LLLFEEAIFMPRVISVVFGETIFMRRGISVVVINHICDQVAAFILFRRLYFYRIKSDYDGVNVDYHVLEQLLKVVKQIINIIVGKGEK